MSQQGRTDGGRRGFGTQGLIDYEALYLPPKKNTEIAFP